MSEERTFPVLLNWRIRSKSKPRSVPWALLEPHRRQANRNHYQTLERLAERGGLSWSEMCAMIEDREWAQMPDDEAEARIMAAVARLSATQGRE